MDKNSLGSSTYVYIELRIFQIEIYKNNGIVNRQNTCAFSHNKLLKQITESSYQFSTIDGCQ